MCNFRWIPWNIAKCDKHGVDPADAEFVVNNARRPFPRRADDDKWLVWGQTSVGDYLEVVYLLDPDDTVFIIHAMPMTDRQKHQLRRRQR